MGILSLFFFFFLFFHEKEKKRNKVKNARRLEPKSYLLDPKGLSFSFLFFQKKREKEKESWDPSDIISTFPFSFLPHACAEDGRKERKSYDSSRDRSSLFFLFFLFLAREGRHEEEEGESLLEGRIVPDRLLQTAFSSFSFFFLSLAKKKGKKRKGRSYHERDT